MNAFYASDVVRGREGEMFVMSESGNQIWAGIRDYEFNLEFDQEMIDWIGKRGGRMPKHIAHEIHGTITYYYGFDENFFSQLALDIAYGNVQNYYFDVFGENKDPNSRLGLHRFKASQCTISGTAPLARGGVNANVLEQTINVIANTYEIIQPFSLNTGQQTRR
ncbi:MAG: phage tail tube protein [Defluviitaleaceae bacterium]|nr:phage tail tube protein [Defluviitaleaceae bacterium]